MLIQKHSTKVIQSLSTMLVQLPVLFPKKKAFLKMEKITVVQLLGSQKFRLYDPKKDKVFTKESFDINTCIELIELNKKAFVLLADQD